MVSDLRKSIELKYPDFPWLEADDIKGIEKLLRDLKWLAPREHIVTSEMAGEGNMNLTLRVRTENRSLILKQSRPWVEKYDHIEAPWNRIHAEQCFYERASKIPELVRFLPQLLATDTDLRLLLIEDLAPATELSEVYGSSHIEDSVVDSLALFLSLLHDQTEGEDSPDFANQEMRTLNHAHIFEIPLSEAFALPLDDYEHGLTDVGRSVRLNRPYVEKIHAIGERYLRSGRCLLHGDFYPGSWMLTSQGIRIIDPEFSFYGDPEFDLGVAIAHFALARTDRRIADRFLSNAEISKRDPKWIARYAAAEVMRRLIGVAQLPIERTDGWRASLLERSVDSAMRDDWRLLWP